MIAAELATLHEAVRREQCAAHDLRYWSEAYSKKPSHYHATMFQGAWCELRAAVDALVALPRLDVDHLALAVASEFAPKGTE